MNRAGRFARLGEPAFVCEHYGLGPVAQAELGEDGRHAQFHRAGSNGLLLGDLGVVAPPGDCSQQLALLVGETF